MPPPKHPPDDNDSTSSESDSAQTAGAHPKGTESTESESTESESTESDSTESGSAALRLEATPNQSSGGQPSTPARRPISAGKTPKSAPAATGLAVAAVKIIAGAGDTAKTGPSPSRRTPTANRQRRLSSSQKSQPTLLTDFLLGRQTQARVAAARNSRQRKSIDGNTGKVESRNAMRQSSVRRLQQPGGVKERVKMWQKASAAAIVTGNPEISPSEPTDIAFEDKISITEADRLRIKSHRKPKLSQPTAPRQGIISSDSDRANQNRNTTQNKGKGIAKSGGFRSEGASGEDNFRSSGQVAGKPGNGPAKKDIYPRTPRAASVMQEKLRLANPPKKRIVSDEHWRKRSNRTPPKAGLPKPKVTTAFPPGNSGGPALIPKDFLQRTARNPTVQSKIKDWAQRVEPPEVPSKQKRYNKPRRRSQPRIRSDSEGDSDDKRTQATSWRSAPDDDIRVRPLRSTKSAEAGPPRQQQSPRGSAVRNKRQLFEDAIRVRPVGPNGPPTSSAGRSTTPPLRRTLPDDGIRVRPMEARPLSDDDSELTPTRKVSAEDDATSYTISQVTSKAESKATCITQTHSAPAPSTRTMDNSSFVSLDKSTGGSPDSVPNTPTKRPSSQQKWGTRKNAQPGPGQKPNATQTWRDGAVMDAASSHEEGEDSGSSSESYGPSTAPPKSLAEIPVGLSAFSELGLPLRGESARPRTKAHRNPSFKDVPHVLKKVVTEGKKMIHDKVDPPRLTVNQPRSIETWLNTTVDPFVESKPAKPAKPVQKPTQPTQPARPEQPTRKLSTSQKKTSTEEEWKQGTRNLSRLDSSRRIHEVAPTRPLQTPHRESRERSITPSNEKVFEKTTPTRGPEKSSFATDAPTTPTGTPKAASSLKRSGANRGPSSPLRSGSGNKPFRDALREAFRGESVGYKLPAIAPYSDLETDRERDGERQQDSRYTESDVSDSFYEKTNNRGRPFGSPTKTKTQYPATSSSSFLDSELSSSLTGSVTTSSITVSSLTASSITASSITASSITASSATGSSATGSSATGSSVTASSNSLSSTIPRRRPPPTSGDHELSTIISADSFSTCSSDTMSIASESTMMQTNTTVTKPPSGDVFRKASQASSTGLKRRLTKHSDLVSVLSLPQDAQLPARARSIKLARGLHRKTSKLESATLEDLLLEFSEDETLYKRELKTLVDGVVPVLLTEFVYGKNSLNAAGVFGVDIGFRRVETLSRAVVDMGVSLEKLKALHKWVPIHDVSRMIAWLETVYPVYDNYLDVWRLGFQGIIVNLAHAPDDSSLVNAMAQNEEGDVLDENGEVADVAYLLRRPLLRIKWMLKFSKGVKTLLGGREAECLVEKLEVLHEKARRRNREEIARKTDEDASYTDTTRARDIHTLSVLENVEIDQTRQVSAKDWFDLNIVHSNGQRLGCQVEVIFRDKLSDPSDRGDILIRETGGGAPSWLLFAPLSTSRLSARRGDDGRSLVLMVRGIHNGIEWYELVSLVADQDDTVTDWLEIFGTSPIPPSKPFNASSVPIQPTPVSPRAAYHDIPVGECTSRSPVSKSPEWDSLSRANAPRTPTRYHARQSGNRETTPTRLAVSPTESDTDKTPTQSSVSRAPLTGSPHEASPLLNRQSRSLREDMRPDSAELKAMVVEPPARGDDAPPPPPVHRTLGSKQQPVLNAPVEVQAPASRVRRRTSSPLKHECHPSDISSESDSISEDSGSEEDSDSSLDDLEEDDMPDTIPGISIKKPEVVSSDSEVSESSITPSSSASQAGILGLRPFSSSEYTLQFMASISYWSNKKGVWKDLGEPVSALVISPGLIEVFPTGDVVADARRNPGLSQYPDAQLDSGAPRPLIALDLTPLVMIRQSTVIDLEIRSPVRPHSLYNNLDAAIFRFRAASPPELANLYTAVHQSRMNNAKFKALEEEARIRSFGQQQPPTDCGDDTSSRRRRTWFGRRNSYRASARAPSQSQGSTSSVSATSFLRRLTGTGNLPFNIDRSFVDKQSRASSGGGASFYTSSGASSAVGGLTPPRSPSVSLAESGNRSIQALGSSNIKMRCHLQISANKWEDHGNCLLTITRPPPGVRQELTIYHGLEKRIIAVSIPRKDSEKPLVIVDVVVGSACFSRLAARGIVLNVWEEVRDEHNRVGTAPAEGAISGRVKKWCFQFSSAAVANWVFGLVASEVQLV